jgi:transcriptional regulator with GAF, ATPase, and Fis domain
MSLDARRDALDALSRFLVTDLTVGDTLQRVAEIAIDAIPGAEIAGMSMLDDQGRPTTSIYTDERSPKIDDGQYESGKGPCLDAWRNKEVVRVDDMVAAAAVYPEFSAAALEHGVLSTLSLPLIAAETGIGALNLYARRAAAFTAEDEALGTDLAAMAAVVLSNVSAYWTAFELGQHLTKAMESRAAIEQAKGWLMAQTPGLDAEAAFDLLRRASQRENRKLNAIASEIIERRRPTGPAEAS